MAETYDVFISHASEDKKDVARPLAEALTQAHLSVWLDEQELTLGDSLRQKIDEGLRSSRFGVVILSRSFFAKSWPQAELDALVTRQMREKTILPVLHGIAHDDLARYSPLLSGLVTASTEVGIDAAARQIIAAVQKESATAADTLALDLSHRQREWYGFESAVQRVSGRRVWAMDRGVLHQRAELDRYRVLVVALPYDSEIAPNEVDALRDWVTAGGGLFLLGSYFADAHHRGNPSSLARAFGFSFANDLIMPPGRTSHDDCQDQAFDVNGKLAVALDVPPGTHPIGRGVGSLALQSACSLELTTQPEYVIRSGTGVVVEAHGRPNERGYLLQIREYKETVRRDLAVVAAWQFATGRVAAAGTWKLWTLNQRDNHALVRNVIDWLRGAE